MNIFVLSGDSQEAAVMQCDKHVPKMLLEATQMLCNGVPDDLRSLASNTKLRQGQGVYKPAHKKHPCSLWAVNTRGNWIWLLNHAWGLLSEYKFRYDNKYHKCEEMLIWLDEHERAITGSFQNSQTIITPFAQAMPDSYKAADPVHAYRRFYRELKTFAKYEKGRSEPSWWNQYSTSTSSPVIEIT
jgi:hypothetical protein